MTQKISFILNGEKVEIYAEPAKRLIDVLRDDFGLVGTKEGCGEGECGACAVLLNGRLVNSCIMPVWNVQDCEVLTIEGFRKSKRFEILSDAFASAGAIQCGFCTSGMIMAAETLLKKYPKPTNEQIKNWISGNLCRCTGMNIIIEAIEIASKTGEGLW